MRAGNEVTVNRKAFVTAVTRVPRGGLRVAKQYTPRTTLIFATPPSLFVETPWVCTELDAEGCWLVAVAVSGRVMIKAARALPRAPRVTLLWFDGRLHLGRLSIDAKVASGYAIGGQVGTSVPERPPKSRGDRPAEDPGQLLMPGIAPVTDRERIERLARAPMRPRRR